MSGLSSYRNVGAAIRALSAFPPQSAPDGAINGVAIDRTGFGSCVLHHQVGAASGSPTAQTVSVKLEHSDDGSTGWTDFLVHATADLTADDSAAEVDVDLSGAKPFVRVVETVSFTGGTSPAIPVAATLVLGGADHEPV